MKYLLRRALPPTLTFVDEETESSLDVTSGAHVGVDLTAGQFFTGLQGRLTAPRAPVRFAPSVERTLFSDPERWQVNADVLFGAGDVPLASFFGAGMCLVRRSEDDTSSMGLNVLGGATFEFGSFSVFVQLRLTVADGVHLSLTCGTVPSSR